MTRRSALQAKADAKATPSSGTPGYGSNETNATEAHSKGGSSEGAVAAVAAEGLIRNGGHPHGGAGNGDAGHGSPGGLHAGHGSAGALSNGSRQAQPLLSSSSGDSRQAQALAPVSSMGQPLGSAGPVSSGEGMGSGFTGRMSSGEGMGGGGFAPGARRQSAAFGRARASVDFARAGSVGHAAAESALPSPVRRRVCRVVSGPKVLCLGPRCRARVPAHGTACPRCSFKAPLPLYEPSHQGGARTVAAFGLLQRQPRPIESIWQDPVRCWLRLRQAHCTGARHIRGRRGLRRAGRVCSGGSMSGPGVSHCEWSVHTWGRRRSWRWRALALRR